MNRLLIILLSLILVSCTSLESTTDDIDRAVYTLESNINSLTCSIIDLNILKLLSKEAENTSMCYYNPVQYCRNQNDESVRQCFKKLTRLLWFYCMFSETHKKIGLLYSEQKNMCGG